MPLHDFFPAEYRIARSNLQSAAKQAGFTVDSYENRHARGSDGQSLFTDTVWVGPEDATSVLVTCAGTHGAEGCFGSGIQTGWLCEERYRNLPDDLAVLHIHAINPYGFSWVRRVTEDNVDLNRNFIDFCNPPTNEFYDEVHSLVAPKTWDDTTSERLQTELNRYAAKRGQRALEIAVTGGQHTHPQGMWFGGTQATWSNKVLTDITAKRLARARRIAMIDLHTGFNPYGHAQVICRHFLGSPAHDRARAWYGDATPYAQVRKSGAPLIDGNLRMAFVSLCPNAQVTSIGIEAGTNPSEQLMMALYADNWLYLHGDPASPQGLRIRADMRRAFFIDDPAWTELVYTRSMAIIERGIQGVGGRS